MIICNCPEIQVKFPSSQEECNTLVEGFQSISYNGVTDRCWCVIDGYLMHIQTPTKSEAKNVRSFFLGHYQKYGVNLQGACDAKCRFLFLGLGGPGVTSDQVAVKNLGLLKLIAVCTSKGTKHVDKGEQTK